MNIVKNIQFSHNIKTEGSLKEFNFRKLQNTSDPLYQIDVSDERGNRHFFTMQLEGSSWKIHGGLIASWIGSVEPLLQEAIEEQERSL